MYSVTEKRRYKRIPTFLSVTYSDGDQFFKEYVYNASLLGLLIKGIEPCFEGMPLDLVVDTQVPIRLKARVAWIKRDGYWYNMGIQFRGLDVSDGANWVEFLRHSARFVCH